MSKQNPEEGEVFNNGPDASPPEIHTNYELSRVLDFINAASELEKCNPGFSGDDACRCIPSSVKIALFWNRWTYVTK